MNQPTPHIQQHTPPSPVRAGLTMPALQGSVLLLLVVITLATVCGTEFLSPQRILHDPAAREVVSLLRLPRVLLAAVVGIGLALSGMIYQALFRNPLASPFSLGISSGAAVGAAAAIWFQRLSVPGGSATLAMVAALGSAALILALSRLRGVGGSTVGRSTIGGGDTIVLVGLVLSFFCSSLLTLVQYLSDYAQLFRFSRWMLGSIPSPSWGELALGSSAVLALCIWVARNHRALDLIWFGEEFAAVKGVPVTRLYREACTVTALVVGWVVAQCGVIGFVGILVPAAARLVSGFPHRLSAPLSAVWGAILVTGCDLLGRSVVPPFEVPVGVFTAVVGGPLFVLLLLRQRGG
jgi:iron complex transport system permease protein